MTVSEPTREGSAITQIINLFVAPGEAFDYARKHPKMWILPLGLTLAFGIAVGVWFALGVNIEAWRGEMLRLAVAKNPQAASRVSETFKHFGRGYLLWTFTGSVFIGTIVIELFYALYLLLADKIFSAENRSYGTWFSFVSWSWLPTIIASIVTMILFAISGVGLAATRATTLNALFFHLGPTTPHYGAAQFSILYFWVIALMTYGLKRWAGHSTLKALVIAAAPFVVIYAILFFVS